MDSKYSTIHQHEPLRTPSEWGTPGKRYTAQLEELFDDLYSRLNRLKLTDLSKSLRTIITESADGMRTNRTAIEQTNEQIRLLASQESLNELTGRIETSEASITVMAEQIESKVSRTELDELGAVVSQQGTQITQTAKQIELKASKSDLDELTGRVTTAESSILQQADQIALKVSTTTYNNGMAGKADSSSVNALAQRVTTAESSITQQADQIKLKVSTTTYNQGMAGKLGVNDPAKAVTTEGSTVVINASGIGMSGGSISMNAGTTFSVVSGGTVQIDAENGDDSWINLGDAFSASKGGGVVSAKGSFTELTVKGAQVLTEESLGARIVISTMQPTGHNILWVTPTATSEVYYSAYTGDSRNQYFTRNTPTRSYTVIADYSDVFGSGSYAYTITVPFIVITSGTETNLHFQAVLSKASDPDLTVTLETDVARIGVWDEVAVMATANSSVNLCEDAGDINVTITITGATTGHLYMQKERYIRLDCTNETVTGEVMSCIVRYIP